VSSEYACAPANFGPTLRQGELHRPDQQSVSLVLADPITLCLEPEKEAGAAPAATAAAASRPPDQPTCSSSASGGAEAQAAAASATTSQRNKDRAVERRRQLSGRVVLAWRGRCSFEEKAKLATEAGARGLIIANNDEADGGNTIFSMGAQAGTHPADSEAVPTVSGYSGG
jgi:hypothetical protein